MNGFGGLSGAKPVAATNARMRLPFSPMDNKTSLRQRRKSSSTFLPPKSSLTEGSYVLDENLESNNSTKTATAEASNTPTAIVGGGDVVLWSGAGAAAAADSWESWVLVYGLSTKAQYDEVLRRFDAFGRVVAQRSQLNKKNWVALHYESILEAEKALCQQTCVLSDGSIVGVSRMDQKMSQSLDWDATAPTSAAKSSAGCATPTPTGTKSGLDESDVLLHESHASYGLNKLGASAYEKFLAFIFGWNDITMQ